MWDIVSLSLFDLDIRQVGEFEQRAYYVDPIKRVEHYLKSIIGVRTASQHAVRPCPSPIQYIPLTTTSVSVRTTE